MSVCMPHRRFRVSRLALIMQDPTRMAEVLFSICNVLVPSVALAIGQSEFPLPAEDLLKGIWLNNTVIGIGGVILGAMQFWGAGTDWYIVRSNIATAISCCLITVITAYMFTGFAFRPTFPLLVGTVIGEMFIAWRTRHEKPVPIPSPSQERHAHGISGTR